MHFTIKKETLLININNVSKALSSKVQMPGLTGILFSVTKDCIKLTTSNNDISIQVNINKDYEVYEEGDFIVQGKYLLEIVKKLNSNEVEFSSFEENAIQLIAGKSVFNLNTLQLESFPKIAFDDSSINFSIDSINLKQIIRKTSFAISPNESRVVLTGVSLSTKDKTLEFVATDSFRLARKQIVFGNELPSIKIIIPGKSLDELNKILEENEEKIEIHCNSSKILFKYQNILFQSRLINGVFPNIESLIPERYLLSVKLCKEDLIQTLERVSIFVNNEISNVIKMSINSTIVEFSSSSNEIGGAKEEVTPLDITSNTNFEVSISSKYFLDALRTFDSKDIVINFTGEIKPLTISGEYDRNLIQLILPLRA